MPHPLKAVVWLVRIIERLLFVLVNWYDVFVYTPIQLVTAPVVAKIPRTISINGASRTVFSANIVSWARTILIIPIAVCLKYGYFWNVFWMVVLHDYLDHVDGIVAKVHARIYGPVDDPLLGGFMDAFCDKVVNVTCLWTILTVTNFSDMTLMQATLYLTVSVVIMLYEAVLGVVRVQDYFYLAHKRRHLEKKGKEFHNVASGTKSVMEGKLKEKLESLGIAFLALSQGHAVPIESWAGQLGIVCLLLSVRLAHASLTRKLEARGIKSKTQYLLSSHMATVEYHTEKNYTNKPIYNEDGSRKVQSQKAKTAADSVETEANVPQNESVSNGVRHRSNAYTRTSVPTLKKTSSNTSSVSSETGDDSEDEQRERLHTRRHSLPSIAFDGRVDKVYTIGCFDLFHRGHMKLMHRMRQLGKQVIVGLHDSRSYFELKKKFPIDSTEKRMLNVKQYADQVYCISSTDPSNFITCIVYLEEEETALYVRGDDMPDFPSRSTVESLMPIRFFPYTQGISSSQLRKEMFSKIQPEDKSEANGYNSDIS